ncbi:hypothetical protein AC579_359 [Pseudocercospora musae]|uniref:Secreted protein n=1 Tax=Pseudocercospora musae TaxID=113226 RepID=A0A139IRC8_9PEZI|nr:hypothetical protein AC579_359 [Pseudocercospora musae]
MLVLMILLTARSACTRRDGADAEVEEGLQGVRPAVKRQMTLPPALPTHQIRSSALNKSCRSRPKAQQGRAMISATGHIITADGSLL